MLNIDSNYNLACFVCGPCVVSRRWRARARQHQTLCHSLVWMLIDDFIIHSYIVTQRAPLSRHSALTCIYHLRGILSCDKDTEQASVSVLRLGRVSKMLPLNNSNNNKHSVQCVA